MELTEMQVCKALDEDPATIVAYGEYLNLMLSRRPVLTNSEVHPKHRKQLDRAWQKVLDAAAEFTKP